ncbi:MAG: MBOAT family O-acyltransferase [Anaerolineales bacterium]
MFFIISFILWWILPLRLAKVYLIIANLVFYGFWFPPFVFILIAVGLVSYTAAKAIDMDRERGKYWLIASVLFCLGVLGYYKYANFFLSNLFGLWNLVTSETSGVFLQIVLPIGISFYTFKAISYITDVYRHRLNAVRNLKDYFLYITFFPQLLAGPIERATNFIPQVDNRKFPGYEDLQFSIYRITRGFFLKLLIADHMAISVNSIFASNYQQLSAPEAWLGALFFAIQIFCDFAGYSDISIGIARLFGFITRENFEDPYLSTSLGEFWRRWHISMSTWFRDYVYYPLARSEWMNSRVHKPLSDTKLKGFSTSLNTVIMFLLSGLWHGANWNFVLWGGMHGVGIVLERQSGLYAWQQKHVGIWPAAILGGLITMVFTILAWVPFRTIDLQSSISYWQAMLSGGLTWRISSAILLNGLLWFSVYAVVQLVLAFTRRAADSLTGGRLRVIQSWLYFTALLFISVPGTDFIYFRF